MDISYIMLKYNHSWKDQECRKDKYNSMTSLVINDHPINIYFLSFQDKNING